MALSSFHPFISFVDSVRKSLVKVKSIKGDLVYTREDYAAFIHHFESLIKDLKHDNLINLSTFGAYVSGFKTGSFDEQYFGSEYSLEALDSIETFKFDVKDFVQEEFKEINNIITTLSKGVFSPAMVNSILKSVLVYQFMQAEVLNVLQKNFDDSLAENFF